VNSQSKTAQATLAGNEVMTSLPANTSRAHARTHARGSALELLEGKRSTRKREGLVQAYALDLVTGQRRRVTRAELAEAYRLLAKHRDVWDGWV
jgi:hypothetical protein